MLLVSDEIIKGRRITKFPGGGLQYGEGLKDCLIREISEELNAEAIDLQHYYTTDIFQQSMFHTGPMQVISVYYRFGLADPQNLKILEEPFGFDNDRTEGCRWIPIRSSGEGIFGLPIDRYVFQMLVQQNAEI